MEFWLFWSQKLDLAAGSYSWIPCLSNHREFSGVYNIDFLCIYEALVKLFYQTISDFYAVSSHFVTL